MADDEDKLFHVDARLDIHLLVVAKSEAAAIEAGQANWYDAVVDGDMRPSGYHAREVTDRRRLVEHFGVDVFASYPYGPYDSMSPQLTIQEYLDRLGTP